MQSQIVIGTIRLVQKDSQLLAFHPALREPVEIDSKALMRWLLRFVREQVAA